MKQANRRKVSDRDQTRPEKPGNLTLVRPTGIAEEYVLRGGDQGAARLRLLSSAYWPTSKTILEIAGLKQGMRYLDVGCGAGDMIMRVAGMLKNRAEFAGIDMDKRVLQIAEENARKIDVKAKFHALDIESATDPVMERSIYDFVYSRSVLTHLKNPKLALQRMIEAAKPGGTILVEDIEFTGSFAYPNCPSYNRFTDLYQGVVKKRGADPNIGPKLFKMFQDAGVKDIQIRVCQPTFYEGDGKLIPQVTMEHIREAVVDAKLAESSEIDQIIRDLDLFARDRSTLLSFPRVFQVWGRKAKQ